jgi:lysophospholipase L1-like esterase
MEVNIYFDNVVLVTNIANYHIDVACEKGVQQCERWTFVPAQGDVGSHELTITVCDSENRQIASAKTNVVVSPAESGNGKAVAWLMVGDSLTHDSTYSEEVLKLCGTAGNPNLTMLGTHHIDGKLPGNRHEGYGGWSFERFATFYSDIKDPNDYGRRGSPFVCMEDGKQKLDFDRYFKEYCGGTHPDLITFALGTNDIFWASDSGIDGQIDKAFGFADQLIAAARKACPKARIGMVMIVPPAATQDAFGENYGCQQTRWQYRRNQHRFIERMKGTYGNREADGIYIIPAYVNIDTVHGFPSGEKPANSCSTTSVVRQLNGCHPAESGYRQMGDTMYYWMKEMINR